MDPNQQGVYTISATLTDDDSVLGTSSTTVEVKNLPPVIVLDRVSQIDENSTATLTGRIIDPGTRDTFTLRVNWGDPRSPHNQIVRSYPANASGTQSFTLTHQYLDDMPGSTGIDQYTIRAVVIDDDQDQDVAETTVRVSNVAPSLLLDPVIGIGPGSLVTLTGTITDPGTLDTFTLLINWGDPLSPHNPTAHTFSSSVHGTQGFTLSHQYLDHQLWPAGIEQLTIRVFVTDDDQDQGVAEMTVLIGPIGQNGRSQ